jgi:hypothetical protein
MAALTVWCLGCDAFERVAESISTPTPPAGSLVTYSASLGEPDSMRAVGADTSRVDSAEVCHCVLGHVAVVSVQSTPADRAFPVADFVDRPPAIVLPAPEPPLRPPEV